MVRQWVFGVLSPSRFAGRHLPYSTYYDCENITSSRPAFRGQTMNHVAPLKTIPTVCESSMKTSSAPASFRIALSRPNTLTHFNYSRRLFAGNRRRWGHFRSPCCPLSLPERLSTPSSTILSRRLDQTQRSQVIGCFSTRSSDPCS